MLYSPGNVATVQLLVGCSPEEILDGLGLKLATKTLRRSRTGIRCYDMGMTRLSERFRDLDLCACSLQSAPAARALGPGDIRKFIISPLLELFFCVLALLMIT